MRPPRWKTRHLCIYNPVEVEEAGEELKEEMEENVGLMGEPIGIYSPVQHTNIHTTQSKVQKKKRREKKCLKKDEQATGGDSDDESAYQVDSRWR